MCVCVCVLLFSSHWWLLSLSPLAHIPNYGTVAAANAERQFTDGAARSLWRLVNRTPYTVCFQHKFAKKLSCCQHRFNTGDPLPPSPFHGWPFSLRRQDEVQLGLARHGSSFAFKEEVLGKSADATRPQPTNPVFPPPCAMPPASYQRDGAARHGKEGGPHHQHHHNNNHPNGACGHAHPPACAIHGGGGGGYNGGASNGADLRWMAAPTEPGSPLPLGGGGGDDRPRLRRRRGQRGRRGSGAGDHSCDGRGTIGGGGGPGTVQEPHGGGGGVYRALSSVPNLDRFYDMGGLANGNLYRPVPKPTPGFGGSDRSTGSSGGSSWGNGCGSPSATAETLSSTPPLELSKLEGFSPTSTSASFFRGGGSGSISNGTAPPPRDVWNQGQFHRHPRPSPSSFSGVAAADAETQRGFLDQHRQLQQQHLLEQQQLLQLLQLQRQQQQLFQQGGGRDGVGVSGVGGVGGGGGVRSQDLLPNLAARQGLNQPRLGEGSGERATIAVLQQQVQQLQRYFETLEGGLPLPPPSLGSGLGEGSSNAVPAPTTGGESSFSDDLSAAEERLAALSWDDDDARTFSQQLGGPGGGEAADFASRRGGADARDGSSETSFWATESAPLVGFGSFAQTSAASQAEVRGSLQKRNTLRGWQRRNRPTSLFPTIEIQRWADE